MGMVGNLYDSKSEEGRYEGGNIKLDRRICIFPLYPIRNAIGN